MNKAKLSKLMEKYFIHSSELEDVLDFVSELLHQRAREIEANEPYALRTIDELDKAAYEVWSLIDYVSELEEE